MKRRKRFRPYIRRANGNETAEGWRMAVRIAFYQQRGRPFYVLVQHGFPNSVMEVGVSKAALKVVPLPVMMGQKTFRRWALDMQRHASGIDRRKPRPASA